MCLGSRNQTVGWADDRSPTNSLESRNGGTRSSATLLCGRNLELIVNTFLKWATDSH
jgi:hypothetical protein